MRSALVARACPLAYVARMVMREVRTLPTRIRNGQLIVAKCRVAREGSVAGERLQNGYVGKADRRTRRS